MTNGTAGLVLLALMSVAYSWCFGSMERLRLSVARRHVSSMLGVFTFAAVVQLPAIFLPVLIGVVYLSAWPTFRRSGAPMHRHVYNAGSVLVACLAAKAAMAVSPGVLAIPIGILVFMALNLGLVVAAILTSRQFSALAMLRNPRTYLVVLATQLLGAGMGTAMQWHVALGLCGLPAIFAVHAAALRGTVADTRACIDLVWRQEAWLVIADEVMRSHRWFSVLMVEPDRADDRESVASVLRQTAGSDDKIGLYGADQLVMLLADTPAAGARMVARRLTEVLGAVGAPAAIGSADSKAGTLHEVLVQASGDVVIRRAERASLGIL
ncbi:MAG: hypothetical protein ACJ74U_15445 [Jatrophihabitantaceae bacterium]